METDRRPLKPETQSMQQEAARIAERLWHPHLGTIHTMVTAADYDGLRNLIARISIDIAIEGMRLHSLAC